jgi:hypothetical protein
MRSLLFSGAALAVVLAVTPAFAEEGMWLPNQVSALAPDLKAAGLALDPVTLADLNAAPFNAIVSLGGSPRWPMMVVSSRASLAPEIARLWHDPPHHAQPTLSATSARHS